MGRAGGPHVVVVLLVQLHLGEAEAGLFLLILDVHLFPLGRPSLHLLGLKVSNESVGHLKALYQDGSPIQNAF